MEKEANFLFVAYADICESEYYEHSSGRRFPVHEPEISRTCIKFIKIGRETNLKRIEVAFDPKPLSITYIICIKFEVKSDGIHSYDLIAIYNDMNDANEKLKQIRDGEHKKYLNKNKIFIDACVYTTYVKD